MSEHQIWNYSGGGGGDGDGGVTTVPQNTLTIYFLLKQYRIYSSSFLEYPLNNEVGSVIVEQYKVKEYTYKKK